MWIKTALPLHRHCPDSLRPISLRQTYFTILCAKIIRQGIFISQQEQCLKRENWNPEKRETSEETKRVEVAEQRQDEKGEFPTRDRRRRIEKRLVTIYGEKTDARRRRGTVRQREFVRVSQVQSSDSAETLKKMKSKMEKVRPLETTCPHYKVCHRKSGLIITTVS